MTFGEKIAFSRKKLGISQHELAEKTGIGLRTITTYETTSTTPRFEKNYKLLADVLDVTVEFLKSDTNSAENDVQVLKNQFNALFAGGKLSENDIDEIMMAVQEAYAITKLEKRGNERMSRFEEIIQIADNLVMKFDSRNPCDLADFLEVSVLFRNFSEQKGIFTVVEKLPFIFINNNLEEELLKMVLAHELGHYILHLDEMGATPLLIDDNIFDSNNNRQEYEANLFTSQILIADEEVLPYIYEGHTQLEIALALRTDVNLVAMKIDTLIKQGHKLNKLEYQWNFM